jgi:hypothetical protein
MDKQCEHDWEYADKPHGTAPLMADDNEMYVVPIKCASCGKYAYEEYDFIGLKEDDDKDG